MNRQQHRFILNRHGHVRHLHFIGIGGVGMSGIAEVMHHLGYKVSGSDRREGAMTLRLSDLGVEVFIGHTAAQINNCDVVVISTAVQADNPELQAARAQRIPVVRRAEMLGELMRFRQGIAVAGTHGKTTTTSLCASVLAEGRLEPTFIVGGRLNSAGTNACLGMGEYLVAEADESDASFLHLHPVITIVTNIDADHMDTYEGDFEKLKATFVNFLMQLPFYGLAIMCLDDPVVRDILPEISKPVLTYGLDSNADFYAHDIRQEGARTHFKVSKADQKDWLDLTLNLPGTHNVNNALAAIVVAHELGVQDKAIGRALDNFAGIARRFQVMGEVATAQGSVLFIDDYGHHPRELEVTLEAIYHGWADRRLVVVFQPHRYTRTRDLFADFVLILAKLDVLILLDVYPAGELPIVGADGTSLYRAIAAQQTTGQHELHFVEHVDNLVTQLITVIQANDIVLTLGAGNIGTVAAQLPEKMKV